MRTVPEARPKSVGYAHRRRSTQPMPATVETVRAALAAEGFGVLTEIDVQATLKKKLGVERRPYLILGACLPEVAHKALSAEPSIGVFLPCNVDIYEGDDGAIYVETVRPEVLFQLVENPAVAPLAQEVNARLVRVLESI